MFVALLAREIHAEAGVAGREARSGLVEPAIALRTSVYNKGSCS